MLYSPLRHGPEEPAVEHREVLGQLGLLLDDGEAEGVELLQGEVELEQLGAHFQAGLQLWLVGVLYELNGRHVVTGRVYQGLGDQGQALVELLVGDLNVVNVEMLPECSLVLLLPLLDVSHQQMCDSRQVLHLPFLTFLLGRNSLHHKVEPLPDGGQKSILHLEDDVVPGPPLESMEEVETLQDGLELR